MTKVGSRLFTQGFGVFFFLKRITCFIACIDFLERGGEPSRFWGAGAVVALWLCDLFLDNGVGLISQVDCFYEGVSGLPSTAFDNWNVVLLIKLVEGKVTVYFSSAIMFVWKRLSKKF